MRKLLVGGNWKQNGTLKFAHDFPANILNKIAFNTQKVEVVVAPTALHIITTKNALSGSNIQVSAQNISQYKNGAYTGEISAEILKDAQIPWVILGHSERRHVFGESDAVVGDKVKIALDNGIRVMACIGEKLDERESGKTQAVNERQLAAILKTIGGNWSNVVIAYEPVWAIGTGKTASPEQAQEVHDQLRGWLKSNVSADVSKQTRILYGGSVTEKNAADLISKPDVDGFLVGGASLKEGFADIIKACNDAKK
jgi:triosephosphate isomerase